MDARDINTAKLQLVAARMGSLSEKVVFLGGTIIPFLFTRKVPLAIRRSKDVDFITDFNSDQEMYEFEDALWEQGFKKRDTGAICRWVIEGIGVDALIASRVLGFNNRWCADAVHYAQQIDIGNDIIVNAISSPSFLGVKLSGYYTRGRYGYARSYDIYDMLLVIAGRPEIEKEVLDWASPELGTYLCNELAKILNRRNDLYQLVSYFSRDDQAAEQLLPQVTSRMERIVTVISRHS